jgi:ABC-type Fe3+/spermidine/putrescine transport system ATPase subunit
MSLTVRDLSKSFSAPKREERGRVDALIGVSLDAVQGQLFTLLGPSGCGKTTLLRCIAGLEDPESGEIAVAGRVLHSSMRGIRVPANRRGLGMVFQSYAIWPHMNVFANVAFPLTAAPRRRRPPRREIRARVERVLDLVKLSELAWRPATDLSGGQQQRLALARSLVMEPPLLLLDEPLSSLDAKLRTEMCFEIRRLQKSLGITAVYVTHDQEEALVISDVVAVMQHGRLEQVGTPREIYEVPASRFVADFIGASNLFEGTVEENANGTCLVRTRHGVVRAPGGTSFDPGTAVVVAVRAERMRFERAGDGGGAVNSWPGVVQAPAFLGDAVEHEVDVDGSQVRVRTDPARAAQAGEAVVVSFDIDACRLLPPD